MQTQLTLLQAENQNLKSYNTQWKGDYDKLRQEADRLNLENPKLRDIVRSYEDQQVIPLIQACLSKMSWFSLFKANVQW